VYLYNFEGVLPEGIDIEFILIVEFFDPQKAKGKKSLLFGSTTIHIRTLEE